MRCDAASGAAHAATVRLPRHWPQPNSLGLWAAWMNAVGFGRLHLFPNLPPFRRGAQFTRARPAANRDLQKAAASGKAMDNAARGWGLGNISDVGARRACASNVPAARTYIWQIP